MGGRGGSAPPVREFTFGEEFEIKKGAKRWRRFDVEQMNWSRAKKYKQVTYSTEKRDMRKQLKFVFVCVFVIEREKERERGIRLKKGKFF